MLGRLLKRRQDDTRVPPGQSVTTGFPILTYGPTPRIAKEALELEVSGLAEPAMFTFSDLQALPTTSIRRDFHCVTRWSKLDVAWTGVRTVDLMEILTLHEGASHVMMHCYGGYTTNLGLDDFLGQDCLLAYRLEGDDIPTDHGGPLRLIVPHLYAWKSAKWLSGLEFVGANEPGFWERNGYHMRGDPFAEERFS